MSVCCCSLPARCCATCHNGPAVSVPSVWTNTGTPPAKWTVTTTTDGLTADDVRKIVADELKRATRKGMR